MNKTRQEISPGQLYRRLFSHILRYRTHLLVGVASGLVVGSSVFVMLQVSWQMLTVVESNVNTVPAVAPAAPAGAVDLPPAAVKWTRQAERLADLIGVPVARADGRVTWQFLALGMLALLVVVLGRQVAIYLNQYCLRWLGARVVRDQRDQQFEAIESQSLSFYGRMDVGRLISRSVADTSVVDGVISQTVADISRAPFEILGAIVFVVLFAQKKDMFDLLVLAILGFPLCIVPVIVLGRRVRNWTHRSLERISDLVVRMHENFTCIRVVKAFHTEAAEIGRFAEENRNYFKTIMRAIRVELLISPAMEVVGVCLGCIFLLVCVCKGLHLSDMAVIAVAGVIVYKPIRQLSRIVPTLERGAAALTRIFETIDFNERLPERPDAVRKTSFDDRIVFEDASFRYTAAGQPVIRHASFAIPRGSTVAVVGATGSGKTTLANLLARFYDPTDGCVRMDGVDLRDIKIADLRKLVGVLTQETLLFNETVAFNIAYGTPDATQAEIEEAARKANAHAFIAAHPDGYNRVAGEKGFVLSGGERQRVAIARIMLRNPPILILDEATSALDTVTERQVQEEIALAMANRTTFAIAHRLSTIRRANLILVVEQGVIVERGTHDELYAANGAYRRLCDMQFSQQDADRG
ncbi:MAG: ABC transporter ATP-binding protein [bacterium]